MAHGEKRRGCWRAIQGRTGTGYVWIGSGLVAPLRRCRDVSGRGQVISRRGATQDGDRLCWDGVWTGTGYARRREQAIGRREGGGSRRGRKRVLAHGPGVDGAVLLEVFGYDAFAPFRGDSAVPRAFRIDDHPGSAAADPQAGRLGSQRGYLKLRQPAFEVLPRSLSLFRGATVGSQAEKDMPLGAIDSDLVKGRVGGFVHSRQSRRHPGAKSTATAGLSALGPRPISRAAKRCAPGGNRPAWNRARDRP